MKNLVRLVLVFCFIIVGTNKLYAQSGVKLWKGGICMTIYTNDIDSITFFGDLDPSSKELSVKTLLIDTSNNPPMIGGYISNYSDGLVQTKGILYSTNSTDLQIDSNIKTDQEYHDGTYYDRRAITSDGCYKEEFNCRLRMLKGNTTYYTRAYIITTDNKVIYGDIQSVTTSNFTRDISRANDYANVWWTSSYTLFDCTTDEIIDIANDGFYYWSNENPTIRYQSGYGYNTCYKAKTEWNAKLGKTFGNPVERPTIYYQSGKIYLESQSGYKVYYSIYQAKQLHVTKNNETTIYDYIDSESMRPEKFTNLYSTPISVKYGDVVCAVAEDSDGTPSYVVAYKVIQNEVTSR